MSATTDPMPQPAEPLEAPVLALKPTDIAALLGRDSAVLRFLRLDRLTPVQRTMALAASYVVALIFGASWEGTLFPSDASAYRVALFHEPWRAGSSLSLPLLHDPVSILAILSAFLTPVICLRQCQAMEELVPVHTENISYRSSDVTWEKVDEATDAANKMFERIGGRIGSAICLMIASSLVLPLLHLARAKGPLSDFRPSGVKLNEWHDAVHRGWWGNSVTAHSWGYLLLDAAGVALYYAVVKQLAMGLVFTNWVQAITNEKFGVFPNLEYNSDGYWGMRVVRRMFQWTYASALLHLTLSLCVIVFWLPIGRVTVIIATFIFVADGVFVMYPTMTVLRAVSQERIAYVRHLRTLHAGDDQTAAIDAIWQRPMLPFRLRSSSSAVFLYLLIPTAVAVLGSRLGK